jgi:hypothetical protein
MVDYLVHQCEGLAADLFLRLRIVADQNAVEPRLWVKSITVLSLKEVAVSEK